MSPRTKPVTLADSLALALVLVAAPIALADITSFDFEITPRFQGEPGATFAGFDAFTSAFNGANTPSLGSSLQSATLKQLVPGAIVTSTGNIYHPSSAPQFELAATVTGDAQEVLLQLQTAGNPLADASFVLEYEAAFGPVTLAPVEQGYLGAGVDEYYARFDLAAVAATVTSFELRWSASAANHSLDVALLDVRSDAHVLTADIAAISLSAGGTQSLTIDAGTDNAAGFYAIFGSATGTGPTPFAGFDVPLTADAYTLFTIEAANGAVLQNSIGALDANGRAAAAIAVPAGTNPSLAGLTLHHAAFVFDALRGLDLVSNAVSVDLQL